MVGLYNSARSYAAMSRGGLRPPDRLIPGAHWLPRWGDSHRYGQAAGASGNCGASHAPIHNGAKQEKVSSLAKRDESNVFKSEQSTEVMGSVMLRLKTRHKTQVMAVHTRRSCMTGTCAPPERCAWGGRSIDWKAWIPRQKP